jgi:IS30 family transposase
MSHTHFIAEERFAIELFLGLGMSCREIAVSLERRHTSISREVRRNGSASGYRAQTAQKREAARRALPRHYRHQHVEPLLEVALGLVS